VSTNFNVKPAGAPVEQPADDAIATDRALAIIVHDTTSPVLQPDQAVLRRRAYLRALGLAVRAPKRQLVTDRIA
jgi:hypothetical protein